MQNIYEDLLAAANTVAFPPRKAGESVSDYLGRLVRAVHTVSDEAWGKLPEATQAWYNEAAANVNGGGLLKDCPGFVDEPTSVNTAEKPAAAPKKTKEEKEQEAADAKAKKEEAKAAKKKEAEDAKANKPERARGISEALRELVILHQDWNTQQLKDELMKNGWLEEQCKVGTLSTIRTDTLSTIKIAKVVGHWRDTPHHGA